MTNSITERKGDTLHEVDIVFNVTKFKFYLTTLIAVTTILVAVFGFFLKINMMQNDIEILKVKTDALWQWSVTHTDHNRVFREDIIRRLDRFELNQIKVYEKLGFKWYGRYPDTEHDK